MTSDPIADMLTRVRNAMLARHAKVDVPASKLKTEIARILKEEGYIANYKLTEEGAKKSIRTATLSAGRKNRALAGVLPIENDFDRWNFLLAGSL